MANLTTIARPYAKAILDLVKDPKDYMQWSQMLKFLTFVVADPKTNALIRNLAIAPQAKADFLCNIAPEALTAQGKNLIKLLALSKRLLIIPALYDLYEILRQQVQHETDLQLTLAQDLEANDLKSLQKEFAGDFSGKTMLRYTIDPSLIGGGKVKLGDRVLDSSIKSKLKALHAQLIH